MEIKINTRRRNELIAFIYNSDAYSSMASIARDFGIGRERVRQILKRYKAFRNCNNCFHQVDQVDSLCSCREISDIIRTPNKCRDWHPVDRS